MMASMPAGLTAATGMDALTHIPLRGMGAFRHVPLESHRANFEEFARFG